MISVYKSVMQVYLISNKITNQHYVGQTMWDFKTRYHGGPWYKWTTNKYLKSSAAKYGPENFEVKILCEGIYTPDELNRLEDFYMKEFNSLHPNGFNFKEAGKKGRNYYNHKEYELIDAKGNEYHVVNLSQFCKHLGLNYGAMLNMVSGVNQSSSGFALKGTPIDKIIDPNQDIEIERIRDKKVFKLKRKEARAFCIEHELPPPKFWGLVNETIYVTHGYKLPKTILTDKIREKSVLYDNIELVHKDGREVTVNSIYDFCKKNDYHRNTFYDIVNGKAYEAYGWRLKSRPNIEAEKVLNRGSHISLKNIVTGDIVETRNLSEFCRQRGIKLAPMNQMVGGYIAVYQDWTLADRDVSQYKRPKKICYVEFVNEAGVVVSAKNPKELEKKPGMACSQFLYDVIRGDVPSAKGWRVKRVKYLNDYYPEIVR